MSDPKPATPRDETPKAPAAPLPDEALDAVAGGISATHGPGLATDWAPSVMDAAPSLATPRTQA